MEKEQVKRAFSPIFYGIPSIKRNKNKKTISATTLTVSGHKVKIIGPYKAWERLERLFYERAENSGLSLKDLDDNNLLIPEKYRAHLEDRYKQNARDFSWDLHDYFIKWANSKNPLTIIKARGRHETTWLEQKEIQRASAHVYVLLKYWWKRPKNEWPAALFRHQELQDVDPKEITLRGITKEIIAGHGHFKSEALKDVDDKNFYDRYIHNRSFNHKNIKTALGYFHFLPVMEPLSAIFPD
ncbi:MAG: hypothetical protein M0Z48_08525 [Nitrospiraceae bacterium]|nr:hypothetical protein [Nitrospiraceae bacterium]